MSILLFLVTFSFSIKDRKIRKVFIKSKPITPLLSTTPCPSYLKGSACINYQKMMFDGEIQSFPTKSGGQKTYNPGGDPHVIRPPIKDDWAQKILRK